MMAGVLSDFLSKLDESDKELFLNSLSQNEKENYCASKEEYRQIFGEDGLDKYDGKPEFQRDAGYQDITMDRLEDRLEEIKELFPEKPSIDALRKKAFKGDRSSDSMMKHTDDIREIMQPSISISISIGDLREKASAGDSED